MKKENPNSKRFEPSVKIRSRESSLAKVNQSTNYPQYNFNEMEHLGRS